MNSQDMSNQVNKVVELYRKFAVIPSLVNAQVYLKNKSTAIIHSTWTQRNLETGTKNKFKKFFLAESDFTNPIEVSTVDVSRELLNIVSPSQKFTAVLREERDNNKTETKQILEIWNQKSMFRSVDLAALDLHGNVYTDSEFFTFEFSPCESKLLYLAEKKESKSEPYYKRKSLKEVKSTESEPIKGDEYLYRQDWGEQLVGKVQSTICIYDIEKDSVNTYNEFPEDLCPGQVHWRKDGKGFIGMAHSTVPRKLGLYACTNRQTEIFILDNDGVYNRISDEFKSVRSPRLTPKGDYLFWLQRSRGGPHHCCEALMKIKLPISPESKPELVVDIVEDVKILKNSKKFYGIYSHDLPNRGFSNDGKYLIFSTPQQTSVLSYMVDLESGDLMEIEIPNYPNHSHTVLDVNDNLILFQISNIQNPDTLVLCKLPEAGGNGPIKCVELNSYGAIPEIENFKLEILQFKQNNSDTVTDFNGIYFGPKDAAIQTTPLILYIHGGPHSNFVNSYALSLVLHATLGFATLLINYRGSTGTGQNSVYFLPSLVGSADVEDCVLATKKCLEKYPELDPKRVGLVGGSHGGFLVAHLSGQYPDLYRTVVARNPVIDIASMYIVSDIPDWCSVEAGTEYTQVGPVSESLMLKQRSASPLVHAHKVKIPTLLLIGSKDLRVPPSQGIEFYHRLKANGVKVRMHLYEDNHSLMKIPVEFDSQVKGMLWLLDHTS